MQATEYILSCRELKFFPKSFQSCAFGTSYLCHHDNTLSKKLKKGKYFCFLHRKERRINFKKVTFTAHGGFFRGDTYIPIIISQARGMVWHMIPAQEHRKKSQWIQELLWSWYPWIPSVLPHIQYQSTKKCKLFIIYLPSCGSLCRWEKRGY